MMKLPADLWRRHEKLVLNVFLKALIRLKGEESIPVNEVPINDLLYVLAHEIWCELSPSEKPASFSLIPNSENLARTKRGIGQEWTRKKPDFRWRLSDPLEKNPEKATKDYTIECKRLGKKSGSYNFINEYVISGIIRYVSKKHSYGIGTKSGAMIGYVQNMVHEDALKGVNSAIREEKTHEMPEIAFDRLETLAGMRRGNHTLKRKEVSPSSFDLRHIWVELMN